MNMQPEVSYVLPTIIAIDDWMVWGRTDEGIIVETCAEMWSEWLGEDKAPEDMEDCQYKLSVLRILKHKRPAWRSTRAIEAAQGTAPEDIEWLINGILEVSASPKALGV